MEEKNSILLGRGERLQSLLLKRANRHGLIAGATGTGKTVSLQILAEGFSEQGVPVFMADVKGDLCGLSQKGKPHPKIDERWDIISKDTKNFPWEYRAQGYPVLFWDMFGKQGHPVRTTVSELGPLLLSRMLMLNEVQEGVLNIAFKVADDNGWLLLDMKDFRTLLRFVGENRTDLSLTYGNVSNASIGAIQRKLLVLEQQGGKSFWGEPALELADLMRVDDYGMGYISILKADKLINSPQLYATFLLWLLSELFEELPEIGDPEKPKLVFFFDEAHLLFDDAPRALVRKVEQVVRLIRSKGVGVYFVTQNPTDVPTTVLSQLGNRIQHALRAFTPNDMKAVKTAAKTFRQNPRLDTVKVISELGVGEALVSTLDGKGTPKVVDQTLIRPPQSRMGTITRDERLKILRASPVKDKYDNKVDRHSAFEVLQQRAEKAAQDAEKQKQELARERQYKASISAKQKKAKKPRSTGRTRQGIVETMAKAVVRQVGSSLGRQITRSITRGIFGSLLKGR